MKSRDIAESYKTLKLPNGSPIGDVKKSFHQLAAKYHPDANPNNRLAAERFKKIARAYEILKTHLRQRDMTPMPDAAKPKVVNMRRTVVRESFAPPPAPCVPTDELILRACYSDNRFVRLHAVRALAGVGSNDAHWCLIKALNDPDGEVAREAAKAIGVMKVRVAVMPLIYVYGKVDFYTKKIILDALSLMDTPLSLKFLRYIRAGHVEKRTG